MRLWLFRIQAFHEPAVLLRCQQFGFCFTARPLEAAGLQALVQQQKSTALPVQCFNPVPASATEQEQRVSERVQLELLLNHMCLFMPFGANYMKSKDVKDDVVWVDGFGGSKKSSCWRDNFSVSSYDLFIFFE